MFRFRQEAPPQSHQLMKGDICVIIRVTKEYFPFCLCFYKIERQIDVRL